MLHAVSTTVHAGLQELCASSRLTPRGALTLWARRAEGRLMRRHPQRARDTPAPADTLSCDAVMADLEQLAAVLPRAAVYTTEARSEIGRAHV